MAKAMGRVPPLNTQCQNSSESGEPRERERERYPATRGTQRKAEEDYTIKIFTKLI